MLVPKLLEDYIEVPSKFDALPLSPKELLLAKIFYKNNFSISKLAKELGISHECAKKRVMFLRNKLKKVK